MSNKRGGYQATLPHRSDRMTPADDCLSERLPKSSDIEVLQEHYPAYAEIICMHNASFHGAEEGAAGIEPRTKQRPQRDPIQQGACGNTCRGAEKRTSRLLVPQGIYISPPLLRQRNNEKLTITSNRL